MDSSWRIFTQGNRKKWMKQYANQKSVNRKSVNRSLSSLYVKFNKSLSYSNSNRARNELRQLNLNLNLALLLFPPVIFTWGRLIGERVRP